MSIATAIKASAGRNGGGGENKGGGSSKMQGVAALGNAAGAVGASTASFAVAYSVEDTQDGSYRDVGAHLTRKFGWTAVPYRRPQKGAAGSRSSPGFVWCVHERDVPFSDLPESQIVNHFQGISKLTSKQGLCELIREAAWLLVDAQEICPRTYDLSQPSHRAEFADDFRLSAAANILKLCSLQRQIPKRLAHVSLTLTTIHQAMIAVQCHLAISKHGVWPGIDDVNSAAVLPSGTNTNVNPSGGDTSRFSASLLKLPIQSLLARGDFGLTDKEWADLLHVSYQIVAADVITKWSVEIMDSVCSDIELPPLLIRVRVLLRSLAKISPQLHCSGTRNIWLAKAPEAARGTGIKILYKLQDIFDLERRMCGRIVQKYIETPLLAPILKLRDESTELNGDGAPSHTDAIPRSLYAPSNAQASSGVMVKFDLRAWVAVTSYQPLRAYIFSSVYGRRCSKAFTLSTKALGNDFVHLANYSVQKATGASTNTASSAASAVANLASSTSNAPAPPASEIVSAAAPPDLLLSKADLIDIIDRMHPSRGNELWHNIIWPELKRRVMCLLSLSRPYVTHRNRSFELLGVDVLLDETLVPWILEVNMSPGLAHRSDQQNALIKNMIEGLLDMVVSPMCSDSSTSNIASSTAPADIASEWELLHTVTLGPDAMPVMRGIRPTSLPDTDDNYPRERIINSNNNVPTNNEAGDHFIGISGHEKSSNVINVDSEAIEYAEFGLNGNTEEGSSVDGTSSHRVAEVGTVAPVNKKSGNAPSETAPIKNNSSTGGSGRQAQNPLSAPPSTSSAGVRSQSPAPKQTQPRFNTGSRAAPSTEAIESKNLLALIQHQFDAAPLLAEGFAITKESVAAVDTNIRVYEKLDLIKRWTKRWFARLHAYNKKRCVAATKIQSRMRIRIAKIKCAERIRWLRARTIQCGVRMLLARRNLQRRVCHKAASAIQRMAMKRMFRNVMFKRVLSRLARKIQLAFRDHVHRKRCVAVRCLIMIARFVLEYRKRCRHIIASSIKLWYFRRRRAAQTIKSKLGPYRYYLKKQRRIRKDFIRSAVNKANLRNKGLRHVFKSKPTTVRTSFSSVASKSNTDDPHNIEQKQGSGDPLSPLFKLNTRSTRYVSPVISAIELVRSIMSPDSRARSEQADIFPKSDLHSSSPRGVVNDGIGSAVDLGLSSSLEKNSLNGQQPTDYLGGTSYQGENLATLDSNMDIAMGNRFKGDMMVSKSLSYSTSSDEDEDNIGDDQEEHETKHALLESRQTPGNQRRSSGSNDTASSSSSALNGASERRVSPAPPTSHGTLPSPSGSARHAGRGQDPLKSSNVYDDDYSPTISMRNERSTSVMTSDVDAVAVAAKKKPMALSLFRAESADLKSKTRALEAKAQLIMDDVRRLADSGIEASEDAMSYELRATLKALEPSQDKAATPKKKSIGQTVEAPSHTPSDRSIRGQKSSTSHVSAVRSLRERSEESIDASIATYDDDAYPIPRNTGLSSRTSGALRSPQREDTARARVGANEGNDAAVRVSYNEWMAKEEIKPDVTTYDMKGSGGSTATHREQKRLHSHAAGSVSVTTAAIKRQEDDYYASIAPLQLDRGSHRNDGEDGTHRRQQPVRKSGVDDGRQSRDERVGSRRAAAFEVPPPWDEPSDASLSLGADSDDGSDSINRAQGNNVGHGSRQSATSGHQNKYSDLDPSYLIRRPDMEFHRADLADSLVDNSVAVVSECNVSGGGSAERLRKNVQLARNEVDDTIHASNALKKNKAKSSRRKSSSNSKSAREISRNTDSLNPNAVLQARLQKQLQLAQENYAKKLAKKEEQMQLNQAAQLTRNASKPFDTSLQPDASNKDRIRSRSREPTKGMHQHDGERAEISAPDANSRPMKARPSTGNGSSRRSNSRSKRASARNEEAARVKNSDKQEDVHAAHPGVPAFALRMAALVQGNADSHSAVSGSSHRSDQYSNDNNGAAEIYGSLPNTARGDFYSRVFQQRDESPDSNMPSSGRAGSSTRNLDSYGMKHESRIPRPMSASRVPIRSQAQTRAYQYDTEAVSRVPVPSAIFGSVPFDSYGNSDVGDPNIRRNENSTAVVASISANSRASVVVEPDVDLEGVDSAMLEWIQRMEARKAPQRGQSNRDHYIDLNRPAISFAGSNSGVSYGVGSAMGDRYSDFEYRGVGPLPSGISTNYRDNPQSSTTSYSKIPHPPPNEPPPRTRVYSNTYAYAGEPSSSHVGVRAHRYHDQEGHVFAPTNAVERTRTTARPPDAFGQEADRELKYVHKLRSAVNDLMWDF